MVENVNRFFEEVGGQPGFNPEPWYNPSGDCVEFFFSEAPCYSRRIDGVLTVYLSDEDDQLVGCKVKGISELVKMIEGMDVTFNHDRIQLSILFGVSLMNETSASPVDAVERQELYRDLNARFGAKSLKASELVSA